MLMELTAKELLCLIEKQGITLARTTEDFHIGLKITIYYLTKPNLGVISSKSDTTSSYINEVP